MKKGSKQRKCCKCGKVVGWIVPTGELIGGFIPVANFKPTSDFAPGKGKYICKDCAEKE